MEILPQSADKRKIQATNEGRDFIANNRTGREKKYIYIYEYIGLRWCKSFLRDVDERTNEIQRERLYR